MKKSSLLSNNIKTIIREDDKAILYAMNLNRNLKNEIIKAWIVSFRIWFSNNDSQEGVIDIGLPKGVNNTYGFLDALEALIKKDRFGVYSLLSRSRNKDKEIPKHFYSIIEKKLLLPISIGKIIPYNGHVYGKGLLCQIIDLKASKKLFVLEEVEIISPLEHALLNGREIKGFLPNNYDYRDGDINYKRVIKRGENEEIEFKSSVRWDYKQNRINKEIYKSILKTIAGFLNTSGGKLLIGVDDGGNILGLEKDINTLKKKDKDGYTLLLTNLISDYIGKEFNFYTRIEFPKIDGKDICLITIEKSNKAAYVIYDNKHKFFIRAQNSTQELDTKEAIDYISLHSSEGLKILSQNSKI